PTPPPNIPFSSSLLFFTKGVYLDIFYIWYVRRFITPCCESKICPTQERPSALICLLSCWTGQVKKLTSPLPRESIPPHRGVPGAVILCLCFLLGVPGNIAVIILKPNFQQLSSMTQSLMLNLAVSDLLCLLTLPLWIYSLLYGWIFGLLACKVLTYLKYCSVYRSLLTVVLLSFQRYMLVVHQQFQTKMRLCLVLLWLVSLILSIPNFEVRQEIPDKNWLRCGYLFSSRTQKLALQLIETLVGFISFFIVAFSYIQLYRKVTRAAFFNNPQTSRLVTSIIIVFFVLWIPYHTINVLSVGATVFHNERLEKHFGELRYIVVFLTFINSCLSPLLYSSSSPCQIFLQMQSLNDDRHTYKIHFSVTGSFIVANLLL
uniref:G-protein coupled receptors family 1 profile domain-containing protein n=1 Tax=Oryzias latipes TaxID=8090 RepID=A0A3B3HZY0_ORYLA